ncbi:MAG TPA: DUF4010 domain-containing protein [Xanthobacteraceae bacterium]|nr:DUF4010 domain-containing protein [Xanthobacteraceae bacterium]
MDFEEFVTRYALALGIGLLIGLERGWRQRDNAPGSRTAGIRTFAISALLGAVVASLGHAAGGMTVAGGIIIGLGFAAYSVVMMTFFVEENRAEKSFSATTAVAAILTFALGAYSIVGDIRLAAALTVATAATLALREPLHGWVKNITWPELRSGLVLLAMTFVVLPIVPDDPVEALGGVNPRQVWLIAITLAGISFVGYAAVKYFGAERGLLFAGAAGGLASSTAVTVTNARHAAAGEGLPRLLAAGVALANAVMFVRTGVIVAVANAPLLWLIGPTLAVAAVTAVGVAGMAIYRQGPDQANDRVNFRNPFELRSVVAFALFLGAVIVLSQALGDWFGATGAIIGAVTLGLTDVDAVSIAMARLAPQTLNNREAAWAIIAAVASNTVSKAAIGAVIGRGRFAAEVLLMALGCIITGAAALWVTFAWHQ